MTSQTEDPRDTDNPFGVLDFLPWDHDWNDHHYPAAQVEKSLALMKEAGVGIVRIDLLWSDIEPMEGRFVWEKYDRLIESIQQHGIQILAILNYSPQWHRLAWNQPPDPVPYGRYASAVVNRYKKQVKYWEIWNEPDHPIYWESQDDMKTYAALLRHTYPLIKAADPTSQVLVGGLSQALPKALKCLYEELGANREQPTANSSQPTKQNSSVNGSPAGCSAASYPFDILNIHPFISPLMPDAMGGLEYLFQLVRKTMVAYGDQQKPIWWTEIGCPGVPKQQVESRRDKVEKRNDINEASNASSTSNLLPSTSIPEWWLGKNPTEAVQAEWVRSVYTKPLAWPGVEKIFWAFFRDAPDHFKNGTDFFGLITRDFKKKPAFEMYQQLSRAWASRPAKANPVSS